MSNNQLQSSQQDEKPTNHILFGGIGFVGGVLAGYWAGLSLHVDLKFQLIIAGLCGLAGMGVGVGFDNFVHSDFARSDDPLYRNSRIAAVVGTVVGVIVGINYLMAPPLSWPIVPLAGFGGAVVLGGLFHAVQLGHERSHPTPEQENIRVGSSYVADWKLQRIRAQIKAKDVLGNVETAIAVATEHHVMALLVRWISPFLLFLFFIWGSKHFVHFREIVSWFRHNPYKLFFVAAALVIVLVWLWRNRKRLRIIAIRVAIYALVILLAWLGFKAPWAHTIAEAFRTGRPEPWLVMALFCLFWMFVRWMRWFFGYIVSTNARVIMGTVRPFPLPNWKSSLHFPANSSTPSDTFLGNIFGYGNLDLDGAGNQDWMFNNMRYVKHHWELGESIPLKNS